MISSRWPRPMAVIESIALIPVCTGSFTGWRSTTPGALNSSGRRADASIGGPPSIGTPSVPVGEQLLGRRHARDLAGAADGLALAHLLPLAEERDADVVLLEVQRDAGNAVLELEQLEREAVLETVDAGDAVSDLEDGANLGEVGLHLELLDPLAEDRRDLFGAQLQVLSSLLVVPYATGRDGRGRWRPRGGSPPAARARR